MAPHNSRQSRTSDHMLTHSDWCSEQRANSEPSGVCITNAQVSPVTCLICSGEACPMLL
ncbi:hypothetical protein CALVIDRAFT_543239 [Calocera viscosa TUFC12733]|uniref:Uncharacterized protein n=1 Tax=Calocera viscosa (strain TUFC12733) TaxID=1330018 RepID=A0A167FT19_CALVF|nr:hypothetical protein CALVIDRAFT_543516 [Calocera viscosa TUFC12733]KZO89814.1 hypothetical protein CALVIDRAFT_543239 [Calocera viscosa TUFC12733]